MSVGEGEGAEVGPTSLCVTCGLEGWTGNQLRGEENMQNAWAPCSGQRAGTRPFVGKCSLTFLPLFLCHEIIPQGSPLLPVAASSVFWPCQELAALRRGDSVTLRASSLPRENRAW